GYNSGLAVTRYAFDTHFLWINLRVWIGLKVVYQLADTPSPGAQGAPIIGLARLALVGQTDNPLTQRIAAAVWLNAAGIDGTITPSLAKGLLGNTAAHAPAHAAAELNQDRNRPRWVGRDGEAGLNIDGDVREPAIVHVPDQRLADNRNAANVALV